MKLYRKSMVLAVAVGGLAVAGLAGGAGTALASASRTGTTATPATTCASGLGQGHAGGRYGMATGQNSPITAAASYVGLSQADLQKELQSGKTLAQVAAARDKSVSGLETALVAAITNNVNANAALNADQKAARLTQVKSHIDTMVNTIHHPGAGVGRHGAGMMGIGR